MSLQKNIENLELDTELTVILKGGAELRGLVGEVDQPEHELALVSKHYTTVIDVSEVAAIMIHRAR